MVLLLVCESPRVGILDFNLCIGGRRALTDTAIKKAQPSDKLQKLSDGGGLQLHIATTGGKLWRWAYRFDRKQKIMAIGVYPDVTLSQARERRDAARRLLASGVDPMAQEKTDRQAKSSANENTFEAVARQWREHWKSNLDDARDAGWAPTLCRV